MQLYEIALPDHTNISPGDAGGHDYARARVAWLSSALSLAGGYTELGTRKGAWLGDNDVTYIETMHWYQVATTPKIMGELVEEAFKLFPDQEAIFYAVVGRAVIMPRGERIA